MALSDCSRQVSWIHNIFLELGMHLGPIPIYANNQGSIFIGSNPVQEICTKHIDVKYHYVRECIVVKKIVLYHIPTKDHTADIFTRILDASNSRSSSNSSASSSSHNTLSLIAW
jgi:hypothetical protein